MNPLYKVDCKLIGICGHAGVGKDTAASYIQQTRDNTWKLAFATPLKEAAAILFGIDLEDFYDEERKEKFNAFWDVSPRQVAQFVGTELVRDNVHKLLPAVQEDFWIRRMVKELNGNEFSNYTEDDVVIISDVRFQNEYEWILKNRGIIINIMRPGFDGNVGIPEHRSEKKILFQPFESYFDILNDSTEEALYEKLDRAIDYSKIYPTF